MRTCPSCQRRVPEDAQFCSYCASQLGLPELARREMAAVQEEAKKTRSLSNAGRLALAIGIVIAGVGFIFDEDLMVWASIPIVVLGLGTSLYFGVKVEKSKQQLKGR